MSQDGQKSKGAVSRATHQRRGQRPGAGTGARAAKAGGAPRRPAAAGAARVGTIPAPLRGVDAAAVVAATVQGLGYESVDIERAARGLLRVTIDRLPGRRYAEPGEAVTVGDCEQVTRQLQYMLEVEGVDYARLEVSSPGLDRPLRRETDYERFAGQRVRLTLREAFAGRKHFEGLLGPAEAGGWQLVFQDGKAEQVLGFTLDEVREARLVPVLDFRGRKSAGAAAGGASAAGAEEAGAPRAPTVEVDGEVSR